MNDKKRLANLFLLISVVVFLACSILNTQNTIVYILQKVSEAAVVGGFADWFAVSALFKHPLGLKIPHTNIIENNRSKLIDSISKTVSDTWLSKQYLALQINTIDIVSIILNLSKKQNYIASLKKFIKKYAKKTIAYTHTKQFDSTLQKYIETYIYNLDIYNIFKNNIKELFEDGFYENLYNLLLNKVKYYIRNLNNESVSEFIIEIMQDDIKKQFPQALENMLDKNFDSIIDNLCDYTIQLIENNKTKIEHTVEIFIENYKNKAVSKDIVITLLEGFNIIDKETLSKELIEQLKQIVYEIKLNKNHSMRFSLKNYTLQQIQLNQTKLYYYLITAIKTIANQNIDKAKTYFIKLLDDNDTQKKISQWFFLIMDSTSVKEFYMQNEFNIKMYIATKIHKIIKKTIAQTKILVLNKSNFEKFFNSILNYSINQLLQHKTQFNYFIRKKLIHIMRLNHHLIGKTVKKYLNDLKQEQLINQIELKVSNDLQYIRINGSIVGSIVGFIIAVISLVIKYI